MNKQVFKQHLAAGIVVLLIAAGAFILTFEMPEDAAIFPRIASSILFLLGFLFSAGNALSLIRNTQTTEQPILFSEFINPLFTLIIVLAYVLCIKIIGFYTSTLLAMSTFMYFMGIRSVKKIVLVTLAVTAAVYIVFSLQLGVLLPSGVLF